MDSSCKSGEFLFTVAVSIFYLRKVLPIKYRTLAKELTTMLLTSMLLGAIIYLAFMHLSYTILNLLIVLATVSILYIGISKILFCEPLTTILNLLKQK